jgi:hypothetical protein
LSGGVNGTSKYNPSRSHRCGNLRQVCVHQKIGNKVTERQTVIFRRNNIGKRRETCRTRIALQCSVRRPQKTVLARSENLGQRRTAAFASDPAARATPVRLPGCLRHAGRPAAYLVSEMPKPVFIAIVGPCMACRGAAELRRRVANTAQIRCAHRESFTSQRIVEFAFVPGRPATRLEYYEDRFQ